MAKNPFTRIQKKADKEKAATEKTDVRLKRVYKRAGKCNYCGEQLPNHTGQCPVIS